MGFDASNTPSDSAVTTMQNAAGANGNGTAITLTASDREVMLKIVGATAVLDVIVEVSFDSGSNYESCFTEDLLAATGIATLIGTVSNPATKRLRYKCPPGVTNIRARVLNFVSGTVTVTGQSRRV